MPPSWSQPLWTALAAAGVLMLALWALQLRTRNAGVVDFGWALSMGGMAVYYALVGPGAPAWRILVGVAGGGWGLRLAGHLLVDRVWRQPEEGRYAYLRAHWGARADAHLLWFFLAQAVLAALLSVPWLLACHNEAATLDAWGVAGAVLLAVAVVGESVADRQLQRFKRDPLSRGRACRAGLWRYSRHPNYFFEWLVWCAFALVAVPAPHGGWALLAPALMLFLVTKVTGVPYTEAQALRSRGDDYRDYQQTTSAFFPWIPRDRTP